MHLKLLTSRHHTRAARDKVAGQLLGVSEGSADGLLLVLARVV